MALEPVPSMSPLVVLAHDDPGTADSLRHAVQSATGWQVVMADPSPAGLAAALATGPSVALVGCAALAGLPDPDRRHRRRRPRGRRQSRPGRRRPQPARLARRGRRPPRRAGTGRHHRPARLHHRPRRPGHRHPRCPGRRRHHHRRHPSGRRLGPLGPHPGPVPRPRRRPRLPPRPRHGPNLVQPHAGRGVGEGRG